MDEQLVIVFRNSGGELDRQTARNPVHALEVLAEMLRAAGELHDGDRIVINAAYDKG